MIFAGAGERIVLEPSGNYESLDDLRRTFATTASRPGSSLSAFTSAIAAYGAFFIPKAYGTSISISGGPELALYAFMAFYALCVVITWFYYTRRNAPVPC